MVTVYAVYVSVRAESGPRPDDCHITTKQDDDNRQDGSLGQAQPRGRRDQKSGVRGKLGRWSSGARCEHGGGVRGEHVIGLANLPSIAVMAGENMVGA